MALGIENKTVDINYLADPSRDGGRRAIDTTVRKNVFWSETFKKTQFDYQRILENQYSAKVIIAMEPGLTNITAANVLLSDLSGNYFSVHDVNVITTGFGVDGTYVFYVKETKNR